MGSTSSTASRARLAGMVLSAVLVGTALSSQSRQSPAEDYESGAYLYRTFCLSCHGEGGKGDGPVADLAARRPTDLTALSRGAGGTFPRDRVMRALDGTAKTAGHEPPAMPNWTRVLRRTGGDDERVVRKRLDALVAHIESMQR